MKSNQTLFARFLNVNIGTSGTFSEQIFFPSAAVTACLKLPVSLVFRGVVNNALNGHYKN